uniref:Uncharacterized protein n=1 Tax=Romanomermis culicivorax TaxID=13658 RepID=A0A915L8R5_ROMCU
MVLKFERYKDQERAYIKYLDDLSQQVVPMETLFGEYYGNQPPYIPDADIIEEKIETLLKEYTMETKEYHMSESSKFFYHQALSLNLVRNIETEPLKCAFTIGASLVLEETSAYPPNMKAVQFISPQISNNDGQATGEAFFVVLEPRFKSNINSVAEKIPVVVTFSDNRDSEQQTGLLYKKCVHKEQVNGRRPM